VSIHIVAAGFFENDVRMVHLVTESGGGSGRCVFRCLWSCLVAPFGRTGSSRHGDFQKMPDSV